MGLSQKRKEIFEVNGALLIYATPLLGDAPTIMEHVNAFNNYSKFDIWPVNTELGFPKRLRWIHFKCIILHYSLFGEIPFKLDDHFLKYLQEQNKAYKIAFFQDEYHHCIQRFRLINDYKINCIFTLLEPQNFQQVYNKFTNVDSIFYNLPGYVDDELLNKVRLFSKPKQSRTIDIGYRSRELPIYMGKGAQEKTDIAMLFPKYAQNRGLTLDISCKESDRIYGDDWYKFIANCRMTLGVEAGVSIFDIEGRVQQSLEEFVKINPKATKNELYEKVLKNWENNIYYRTISPRIFENAAFNVLLILFEGSYSGILKPYYHYIPLKKDFSNIEEVFSIINDEGRVDEILRNAYQDLISSGKYHYRILMGVLDDHLISLGIALENQYSYVMIRTMITLDPTLKILILKLKRIYATSKFPGKGIVVFLYRFMKYSIIKLCNPSKHI